MNFTTPIPLAPSAQKIDHQTQVLLLGSCFTESIGGKLTNASFQAMANPSGITFNPISIAKAIDLFLDEVQLGEEELFESQGLYHHFQFSSVVSRPEKAEALAVINECLKIGATAIPMADVLIVTFGSAWAYNHKEKGIVANCHKVPQQEFDKVLLPIDQIVETWTTTIERLLSERSDLRIIFTVSPVRHWKDGAIQNQRSKAHLIGAVHTLVDNFECCEYFPSYEIMMDELRDYRFYADDLLHPSKQAIEVIWERFGKTYFSEETWELKAKLESLAKALNHQPFHPVADSYRKFVEKQVKTIAELKAAYPFLNLQRQEKVMQEKLTALQMD